ncbi:MAG: hypothetical protein ACK58L_04460 [Planctomycetota bacterium]
MLTNIAGNSRVRSESVFAGGVLLFMSAAFLLTILAPVILSIVIVFLFAGPHNYAEVRYFLTRLPARMGRLRPFFMTSFAGIVVLSATLPLLTRLPVWFQWPSALSVWFVGLWNTGFILWCTVLVHIRSRQAPRHDWAYAWPIGIAIIGLTWLSPLMLPFLLVYAHPLMALWILDNELKKSSASLQRVYRRSVLLLPLFLVALWMLAGKCQFVLSEVSPHIKDQILRHTAVPFISRDHDECLVATHAFLELLHYGVWLIAIPLIRGRVFSREFAVIPLMKSSDSLRAGIRFMLVISVLLVLILWIGFAADYTTTRNVYFTVATFHVLAEIPFLLRLL